MHKKVNKILVFRNHFLMYVSEYKKLGAYKIIFLKSAPNLLYLYTYIRFLQKPSLQTSAVKVTTTAACCKPRKSTCV